MQAIFHKNSVEIVNDKGVALRVTPSQLSSSFKARIPVFKMIKERRGNWEELQQWLLHVLGWVVFFSENAGPFNIEKEREFIRLYRKQFGGAINEI